MPLTMYVDKRFRQSSLDIIDAANIIINDYAAKGFILTLRQLYYQFVARGWLTNTEQNYTRIGTIVSDARLAGLIDWAAIEDRTRRVNSTPHWSSPAEIVHAAAESFRLDKWASQPLRIEVWIEKDALLGVIEPACVELDVPYFACRGYSSQSAQWRAGERFNEYLENEQGVLIIHLGDHDPSGIDMTRDNQDRLDLFTYNYGIEVRRIALNMDQIRAFNPPPNPAKLTDTRAGSYISRFGPSSWELDALDPTVIDQLIRSEIIKERDDAEWDKAVKRENKDRTLLNRCSIDWTKIEKTLTSKK